jgi:ankyrin repeat protein
LHWCARYGEIENVRNLLNNNAYEYIPDANGYTPIDYAGLFNHQEVIVAIL